MPAGPLLMRARSECPGGKHDLFPQPRSPGISSRTCQHPGPRPHPLQHSGWPSTTWASRLGPGVCLPRPGGITSWTCRKDLIERADGRPREQRSPEELDSNVPRREFIRKICTLMESHLPSTHSPSPSALHTLTSWERQLFPKPSSPFQHHGQRPPCLARWL